jgi:DNA-binding NarL/FixJ family response regulator
MQIKVLVACREKHLAFALTASLVSAADRRIDAEATDISGVLARAAITRPDVILLEHSASHEQTAWDLLAALKQFSAATQIVFLCNAYSGVTVARFVAHGASGCILQSAGPLLLAKAVVAVHAGEPWFQRIALLEALRGHIAPEPALASLLNADQELLTTREREIVGLIGSAMTNKEIARQLKISDKTVKTHLHHIYVKLHKSGRYKVVLSAPPESPILMSPTSRQVQ